MHEPLRAFIESVAEAFPLDEPIYEFGYGPGLDSAIGPMLENAFPKKGYFARRESEPAEIDRFEDMVRLPFPDGSARTVIAIHTLEHVFEPRRAVEEMIRILAPGGILVLSSQSLAQPSESAYRYWQPTPRALQRLLAGLETTLIGWQGPDHGPHTLFGIAAKPPGAETFFSGVGRFLDGFQKRLDEAASQIGWRQRLKRLLMGWGQDRRDAPASRSAGDFRKPQFVLHLPARGQLKHQLLASCLPEENSGAGSDTSR